MGKPQIMPLTPVGTTINDDVSSVDTSSTEAESELESSLKSKWSTFWKNVTIEPMLLLQMIALSGCMVNVQNYYIEAICMQEHNDKVLCKNLTAPENKDIETEIEKTASLYATYRGLIEAGLPIIFSLFLGSWSDKHGSKVPMVLPLFGYTISAIIYTVFAYMPGIDPGILLIASVPVALTGGLIALIMSAFRYIADITTVENRSFRIAMAEGCWFLGSPFGLLGSAVVYKYGDFHTVFLISAILYGMSLIYAIFAVKNDKPENELGNSNSNMFQDIFNVAALKDTIRTCFRKRPGNGRVWIIILLGAICFRILSLYGGFGTTFLYTRNKLGWGYEEYSLYSTIDGVIGLTGSGLAIVIMMKVLKISDATIGLMSSISCLGGIVVFMLASSTWMMYLGATVQMFCGLISIVIRSMLSKIVSKDELGKVFSILASGEATMPLIAAPLYNLVFMQSAKTFPEAVYFLSGFFNICIVLSFVYFFIVLRNRVPHSELEEDATESRA